MAESNIYSDERKKKPKTTIDSCRRKKKSRVATTSTNLIVYHFSTIVSCAVFLSCLVCVIKSVQVVFYPHKHDQLIFISARNMSFIQTVVVETFLVLVMVLWSLPVLGQLNNEPSSPCPSVFQYVYYDNEWYGDLEVPSPPIEHREVILYVTLSLRASTNVSDFMIEMFFVFFFFFEPGSSIWSER